MYLPTPPSVFPCGGGSQPFVTSSLHPSAFQQFLACSSPVFVEPSQWEVGSRHILYSPADWSEHFICSGTDFGLVKQTHISVYFRCTQLCLGVFLCECAPGPARCYSTRSYLSYYAFEKVSQYLPFFPQISSHLTPHRLQFRQLLQIFCHIRWNAQICCQPFS